MSKSELKKKYSKKVLVFHRKVFDYIYEAYLETESSSCAVSYDGFYKNLSKTKETSSTGKIFVSPSDFLAQTEITVKRLLTGAEYKLFLAGECPDDVKNKLGRAFIYDGLHPLGDFLRPVALELLPGVRRL